MAFSYQYPRPALSADCVLLTWADQQLKVLLIERRNPPFAGSWALPGGFVDIDESPETAAIRELEEETHLTKIDLHQLGAYGAVDRDPRTRVVTIAFWGLVRPAQMKKATAGDDAAATAWHSLENLPSLAFDHAQIIADTRIRLRQWAQTRPFAMPWLATRFSAAELAAIYQAVWGKLEARSLIRQLLQLNGVAKQEDGQLTFVKSNYRRLAKLGYCLRLGDPA